MDTSTSFPEAINMPVGELLDFWGNLCEIGKERQAEIERQRAEALAKSKGGFK